jgi:anaerobic selenocysteine-containing dehydrogenase
MKETTTCGLDCYDACSITVDSQGKLSGDASHPVGNGALCVHLHTHLNQSPRIDVPLVDGKEVSMQEALDAVASALDGKKSLLWRGSGNVGVMQEVTNLLMEKVGGSLTKGSLCDGAGDAGILLGRGVNKVLPLEQIAKADTVVVWGRNVTVTNAHLMPYLEGKELLVIDPVQTPIAKKASLHLQIAPRTDYYVAILLARFIFMEDSEDTQWLEEFAPEFEDFYDYTREHRIKAILSYVGLSLGDMGDAIEYLRNKKVVFLVGAGVQKYSVGASTLHAIDSLAATLGLFGQEGCGVSYLSNSKLGFENPFAVDVPCVSKVNTPFASFESVIVQGGNPAASMPSSSTVCEALESVENLIYFGLYENETSQKARIVIPAKNFLEKEDIRLSYGHHYVQTMAKVKESHIGMSEYEFTQALFERLGFEGLQSEASYLKTWLNQCQKEEAHYISPAYEATPYANGFGKEGGDDFEFIEEYEDDFVNTKRFRRYRKERTEKESIPYFWLLSPKSVKSLNTQFQRGKCVELPSTLGYIQGEHVRLVSDYGTLILKVKINDDIRDDCVVVRSSVSGVNQLTPNIVSEEGENACYQEVKVRLERV